MFFDSEALALAEEISKKGYINAKGQLVKGAAAVAHWWRESRLNSKINIAESGGLPIEYIKNDPKLGKKLLKSGGVVVLGIAAWKIFSAASASCRKRKEADLCENDPEEYSEDYPEENP